MHKLMAQVFGQGECKNVFELGCRDGEDTLSLAEAFPSAVIHTFEANPEQYPVIKTRISSSPYSGRIKFVERAVWSETTEIPFRINRTINVGASSVFPSSGLYDRYEKYQLDEPIMRPAIALKDYVELTGVVPDVIWSDLQGADLAAFIGLGDYIDKVKVIYSEMNCVEMYSGAPTFVDIYNFLWAAGFGLYFYRSHPNLQFGDGLFLRRI